MTSSNNCRLRLFSCVLGYIWRFCVKVKLFVPLLYVHVLSGKAIPEMTYTVLGGMFNPTHLLTHFS